MFPDPKSESDLSSEGKCAGLGGVGDGEGGRGGEVGVRGPGKPEPNRLLEKTGLIWLRDKRSECKENLNQTQMDFRYFLLHPMNYGILPGWGSSLHGVPHLRPLLLSQSHRSEEGPGRGLRLPGLEIKNCFRSKMSQTNFPGQQWGGSSCSWKGRSFCSLPSNN